MGEYAAEEFKPKVETDRILTWLDEYMQKNSDPNSLVFVGISGGKDSTITAAACAKVLGKDRVIGISIPDKGQTSKKAFDVGDALGIRVAHFDLKQLTHYSYEEMGHQCADWGIEENLSNTVLWNHPARLRMAIIYMWANQFAGRVANTCNMSETYVGYDTRWGDQCGDFSLFQNYTATEVKAIGRILGVPDFWVDQTPSDDLCGLSDEDRWGFRYFDLDRYLRGLGSVSEDIASKIDWMHQKAVYKIESIRIPCVPFTTFKSKSLI